MSVAVTEQLTTLVDCQPDGQAPETPEATAGATTGIELSILIGAVLVAKLPTLSVQYHASVVVPPPKTAKEVLPVVDPHSPELT